MPPRPSRNLDRALIAAGLALYPKVGSAGLTIRQVADAAGVNIGMFHYHFKTREAFLQAVMQSMYEDMFAQLPVPPSRVMETQGASPAQVMRMALSALGRFARVNRAFIARLLIDALSGDPVARQFVMANFPRHGELMALVIEAAQAAGEIKPMPVPQVIAFCAGAISMPMLPFGAMLESGALPKAQAKALEAAVLSEAAVEQRIDLVMQALSTNATPAAKPARKRKAKP